MPDLRAAELTRPAPSPEPTTRPGRHREPTAPPAPPRDPAELTPPPPPLEPTTRSRRHQTQHQRHRLHQGNQGNHRSRRHHRDRVGRAWRVADVGRVGLDWLRRLAVGWLLVTVLLAACALLPRAFGWPVAVVVSGSMQPAIGIGDLVVVDPGDVAGIRPGQIVLVNRPGFPGQLLTHRVARVLDDGALVTRGDANRTDDPAPVPRRDVLGVVRLVIPMLGRPAMLGRRRDAGDLVWTGLLLAPAVLIAACGRPPGQDRNGQDRNGQDRNGPQRRVGIGRPGPVARIRGSNGPPRSRPRR